MTRWRPSSSTMPSAPCRAKRRTASPMRSCGSIVKTPVRSPTPSALGAEEQTMDAVTDKVETAANERLVLDMVDKFLATEVKPHVHALEHDDVYPAAIVEKMKEMGLFGCVIASEYGGLGLSTSTYAKIIEHISAV